MPTTKEQVHKIVDELPDSCTIRDVMYHLYLLEKINEGEEDIAAGRTIPHAAAMKEVEEWLSNLNGRPKRTKS
jgi:predicted transcriptional regulator